MSGQDSQTAEQNFSTQSNRSRNLLDASLTATQRFDAIPDQRNRAILVRADAANSGQVYSLTEETFGIGRHPDNAASIDDQGLSRFHLKITKKEKSYWLEDLNSSNGTYLNGRRITSCELANGDTVQLGPRVAFRFSLASQDEENALKQLYDSSVRDPMTRLYNRHYFANQLESEFAFAIRHRTPLSVLLLDVDFFKKVNDTYGHQAGDEVLKSVAKVLGEQLRTEDVLARYGGEEFVVLLRQIKVEEAELAAERLRKSVKQTAISFEGQLIPVTVSIGCAGLGCLETPSPDELLKTADERLYQAKEQGRNRVVGAHQ